MPSAADVLKLAKEKEVKFVDFRFTDTLGKEQHVSVPAKYFTMDKFDSGHAYHFVTITPAGSGAGPFSGMLESVRRISAQEAAAVRPRILRIVTVGANDTIDSLAGRMAYPTYQRERFLVLNGLADDSGLRPGQKVKLVVYGNRS